MAKFIVEFQYNVDRGQRQAYHEAHASYLYSLAERGVLLLGGPLVAENAGLLLYEVADREELERVLAAEDRAGRTDPYRRVAALLHLCGVRG